MWQGLVRINSQSRKSTNLLTYTPTIDNCLSYCAGINPSFTTSKNKNVVLQKTSKFMPVMRTRQANGESPYRSSVTRRFAFALWCWYHGRSFDRQKSAGHDTTSSNKSLAPKRYPISSRVSTGLSCADFTVNFAARAAASIPVGSLSGSIHPA